jgi:hypothetical protein
VLEAGRYRPIASVPKITAPVLYITATTDSLCPPDVIEEAVKLTPDARQKVMDCTHFDVYNGERFEVAIKEELGFLLQHLAGGAPAARAAAGGGSGSGAAAEGGSGGGHEEL